MVNHISGNLNSVADALSRVIEKEVVEKAEKGELWNLAEDLYGKLRLVEEKGLDYEDKLQEIYEYLRGNDQSVSKRIKLKARQYRVDEVEVFWRHVGVGLLVGGRWIRMAKLREREDIIKQVHDGHGHYGCQSTWGRLYLNYWWSNAYDDVKNYIKSCYLCQLADKMPRREALNKIDVMHIFERWGFVYLGPFARIGTWK